MDQCISMGKPFLIENVQEWLDPALDPIFQRDVFKRGLQYFIKIGDNDVVYNHDFKLFMTCRMANPHFLPELTIKVNIF